MRDSGVAGAVREKLQSSSDSPGSCAACGGRIEGEERKGSSVYGGGVTGERLKGCPGPASRGAGEAQGARAPCRGSLGRGPRRAAHQPLDARARQERAARHEHPLEGPRERPRQRVQCRVGDAAAPAQVDELEILRARGEGRGARRGGLRRRATCLPSGRAGRAAGGAGRFPSTKRGGSGRAEGGWEAARLALGGDGAGGGVREPRGVEEAEVAEAVGLVAQQRRDGLEGVRKRTVSCGTRRVAARGGRAVSADRNGSAPPASARAPPRHAPRP